MTKHLIWAASLVVCVGAIAFASSSYYVEQAKTDAFVGKACVDAGGQWLKYWGGYGYYCKRPETK